MYFRPIETDRETITEVRWIIYTVFTERERRLLLRGRIMVVSESEKTSRPHGVG